MSLDALLDLLSRYRGRDLALLDMLLLERSESPELINSLRKLALERHVKGVNCVRIWDAVYTWVKKAVREGGGQSPAHSAGGSGRPNPSPGGGNPPGSAVPGGHNPEVSPARQGEPTGPVAPAEDPRGGDSDDSSVEPGSGARESQATGESSKNSTEGGGGEAPSPVAPDGGSSGKAESKSSADSDSPSSDPAGAETVSASTESERPRPQWGGVAVRPEEVTDLPSRAARDLFRELERLTSRFEVGAGLEVSPRIDGARLVREIVSRRVRLPAVNRREMQPGAVLFLADVSGSCSAASRHTVAAVKAAVSVNPDRAAYAVHSNGYIVDGNSTISEAVGRLLGGRRLAVTVAFGDWDAAEEYHRLASLAPLVWLDSFGARSGRVYFPTWSHCIEQSGFAWTAPAPVYVRGVNSAERAVIALRQIRRRLP